MSLSEWDMIKYSRARVGLSKPQIYLKLRGAWTGVHQDPVSICSVNLNYG